MVSPPCRHVPTFQNESRPRCEIMGTAPLRTAKKVDLTPGMESGMRPPKSGLSMTVSTFYLSGAELISRIWRDGWLPLILVRGDHD